MWRIKRQMLSCNQFEEFVVRILISLFSKALDMPLKNDIQCNVLNH